ncbi:MAG: hypothetical protein ABII07_02300 [Patescibacteria group bacterium]
METKIFISTITQWFESWFNDIHSKLKTGNLKIDGVFSFPSFLRVGESPHHYITELCGAKEIRQTEKYSINSPKSAEKVPNVASFLNPGFKVASNASSLISVNAIENSFVNLTLASQFSAEEFSKTFNIQLNSSTIKAGFDKAIPISVTKKANKLLLREIDLVRTDGLEIFFKRIFTALVVKKDIEYKQLIDWLDALVSRSINTPMRPDIFGLNLGYGASDESFSINLLGLANQTTNEKVIDRFIADQKECFAISLGYKNAISQPTLKLIDSEGLDSEGKFLQPDYLMEKENGTYDIIDLKKALVPSVTVGKPTRLRFSAYVSELIGQLQGYRRYFELDKNSKWAKNNLGIRTDQNLRLIGIVGNHNNFSREKVDIAISPYKNYIKIYSYSDVIDLLKKRVDKSN